MRVLVTGGAGFVGSHLVAALRAMGDDVVVVDNLQTGRRGNLAPDQRLVVQDICEPLTDAQLPPPWDRIYHLACAASPPHYQRDPLHTTRTCVVGTWNVLAFARRHGARVLFTSTSEVYGQPEEHPQRESYRGAVSTTGPRACYDEGKRCAETLLYDAHRQWGLDVRCARVFNTYGPGMALDDGRVVTALTLALLRGQPLPLHGDGSQTRSFQYVSDLVDGLMALQELPSPPAGPVNIGNPDTEVSIANLARHLTQVVGGGATTSTLALPRPADDPIRRCPDITLARELLAGWQPRVALQEGLTLTVADIRSRLSP